MDEQENHDGRLYRIRHLTHWGSTKIVSKGRVHYAHLLHGIAVELNDAPSDAPPVGLLTYHIENKACEIVTLDSLQEGAGVGSLLIEGIKSVARDNDCKTVWLITTNDNMSALRFYQKRGFEFVAVYPNALAEARKLKPQIPLVGIDGIPLRDEIELVYKL
jgi:GNAT superfamily N-acetyltransferase